MPPRSVALLQQLRRWTAPPSPDAELLGRWVRQRDEEAFAALVARHGPMVLGLCRRVLGNSHDAEDAFQAVFLILARKAGSLRHPEALAGWLHGVAVRLASKARAASSRRRATDPLPATLEPPDAHPEPLDLLSARELLALIDQEIACLPEVYRLPLVLCDLEDRTQEEAARLLGWTCGSLRGRLLRGRARLRSRLARRGIAPAALTALFAAGVAWMSASAAVPPVLSASVSRLAVSSAMISPAVVALMRDGMRSLMLAKLKLLAVVLLTVGAMAAGAGLLAQRTLTPREAREHAAIEAPPTTNGPEQLAKKPEAWRDRDGNPLPAGAVARLGTLRFRHAGHIEALAFSADGKTLASCGAGLRFWDVATGMEVQRFAEQSRVWRMLRSPDGKWLLLYVETADPKGEPIEIRDFNTGRLLRRFGHPRIPTDPVLSPDGKILASVGDRDIELWDVAAGRHLRTLKGHRDRLWSVAFSADGKTLISGSDDKTIRFWDVATGKELRQIKHNQGIGKIARSPDGKLLASIDTILHWDRELASGYWSNDTRVRLWDAAAGKELRTLAVPANELLDPIYGIRYLGFAPDGKTLLTGSGDGTLRIWDPATGKELRQFPGFAVCPGPFAFAPDGKSLAVIEGGSTIRLLDLATGQDRLPPLGHRGRVSSISVSPDGPTIATIGQDKTLRFWEPETGRELRRRAVSVDNFGTAGLRPDGRTYLTVGPDELYRLHDLGSGEERAVLRGPKPFFPFALSPDGKVLASVNAGKEVRLLDPTTGAVRHTLTKVKHYVKGMSFSADGRTLVVWDGDRNVTVWDAATGKKRRQFPVPTEIGTSPGFANIASVAYGAVLSPDGRLLAFALQVFDPKAKQGILPVLDTATGREVCRFITAKEGADRRMAFSPDSKSLAWLDWRESAIISLGEIASGQERHHFAGYTGHIYSLAFSPDGKMLISGSDDTTALVWDLTGRLTLGKKFGQPLSAKDLESHWKTLAAEDAAASYRAILALAADPEHSLPFLRTRMKPVPAVDEERLKRWIAELGSEQFAAREKAAAELEKQGQAALHALRQSMEDRPALEMRRRLEPLIEKAEREEWALSPEQLRTRRALEVLERAGTPGARRVLETLAGGAPAAWLTLDAKAALERLSRR